MFKDDLIKANIISNLFISMAIPVTQKVIYSNISSKYISLNFIIICLGTIFIGRFWHKFEEKLYKYLGLFIVLVNLFYGSLVILLLTNSVSYEIYYIINTFLFVMLTKNILFGKNKLKSLRYKSSQRNGFDNNIEITNNLASLIGYIISFVLNVPAGLAFVFLFIGMLTDGVFSIKAYKKSR